MSQDATILEAMQKFLWRAIESGRAPQLAPPVGNDTQRTQLCRVDVPMWMAGGWVVTIGPQPLKSKNPLQELPGGQWPADTWQTYAEIKFGHGSATHLVEVDVGPRGQRIGVFGSTVEVTLVQPPNATGAFVFGYPYRLPGSIVRGELGAGNHCQRTIPIGDVAASSLSGLIAIPPFARNVTFQAEWNQAQLLQVRFYRAAGSVQIVNDYVRNGVNEYELSDRLAIPNDAIAVQFLNSNALPVNDAVAIFELHL